MEDSNTFKELGKIALLVLTIGILFFISDSITDSVSKSIDEERLLEVQKNINLIETLINLEENKLRLDKLDLKHRDSYLTEEKLKNNEVVQKHDINFLGSFVDKKDIYYMVSPEYLEDNTNVSSKRLNRFYYNLDKGEVVYSKKN